MKNFLFLYIHLGAVEGLSVRAAATKLGVSRSTAGRWLRLWHKQAFCANSHQDPSPKTFNKAPSLSPCECWSRARRCEGSKNICLLSRFVSDIAEARTLGRRHGQRGKAQHSKGASKPLDKRAETYHPISHKNRPTSCCTSAEFVQTIAPWTDCYWMWFASVWC
jgi:hypothetical protein